MILSKTVYRACTVLFLVLIPWVGWAAMAAPPAASGPAGSGDVVLLILYILLALVFSFLCSVSEAVLLSITPSYIAELESRSPQRAARVRELKQEKVDRSLAAILTLNTIAHTVGAIGSGAKATIVFGNAWFGVFSAVMTLLILFLSEIIPKTLGAVYWRSLTGPTMVFIRALIWTLYPLIYVSEKLTQLVAHGGGHHGVSREEFLALAGMGATGGHLNEDESRVIQNLLKMDSLHVRDILTPRTVMVALPESLSVHEALAQLLNSPFSRIPVYQDGLDKISGFVLRSSLLLRKAEGQGDQTLDEIKRAIITVPATMPLSVLLGQFLEERQHIAIAADEYGGTEGLVTLEDVVETLLGLEILDERDQTADLQQLARQKWAKRAQAMGLDLNEFSPPSDAGDPDLP